MSETFKEDYNLNINTEESNQMQIQARLEEISVVDTTEENCREIDNKKMLSKNIQVDLGADEILLDIRSDAYWQDLFEIQQQLVVDVNEENKILQKLNQNLMQQNIYYKVLLRKYHNFMEAVKEVITRFPGDTEIDVSNDEESDNG